MCAHSVVHSLRLKTTNLAILLDGLHFGTSLSLPRWVGGCERLSAKTHFGAEVFGSADEVVWDFINGND